SDNVTFEGNTFAGGATQLVYMNGTQSVGVASTNIDFVNNTFSGTAAVGAVLESTGGDVTGNIFGPNLTTGLSLPEPGNIVTNNDFTTFGNGFDLSVRESFNMNSNPTAENLSASAAPGGITITGNNLGNT